MVRMGLVYKDDLYRVVDEAFEYLGSQKTTSGENSGWHQFLESGKIGYTATAQVLILYNSFSRDIPTLESCLASFTSSRREVAWQGNTIYGWSYLSSGPPVPCIEPTCWVYLAHNTLSTNDHDRIKSEVHGFIQATCIDSQEGISWGFTPWTQSRVSPTCMAIRVLSRIGDQELASEAARWLLSARDSQGLWGPSHRSRATITHTSLAVLALVEAGYSSTNPILITAYLFLAGCLKKWLSVRQFTHLTESNVAGFSDLLEVPIFTPLAPQPTRIRYNYNPLMLSALALSTDLQSYLPYVESVAIQVIKDWDTKRWKHPLLEKDHSMTSWSFYDHMHVLEPLFHRWSDDRNTTIFYLLLPNGSFLIRLARTAGFLRIICGETSSLLFRVVLLLLILILLMWILFRKIGLIQVLAGIILSLIASFIYGWYRKR